MSTKLNRKYTIFCFSFFNYLSFYSYIISSAFKSLRHTLLSCAENKDGEGPGNEIVSLKVRGAEYVQPGKMTLMNSYLQIFDVVFVTPKGSAQINEFKLSKNDFD